MTLTPLISLNKVVSCMDDYDPNALRVDKACEAIRSCLTPVTGIAWPWFVMIGTSVTLIVGILSSFTHAATAPRAST